MPPLVRSLVEAALEAADPGAAIDRTLRLDGSRLWAGRFPYRIGPSRSIKVVGMGKAAVPMARSVERILGHRLESGLIVVKRGFGGTLDKTRVLEAGHPEPDESGLRAASELISYLRSEVGPDDLVMVLVSGGASALLPSPVDGLDLRQKQRLTARLLTCGAEIDEINAVRKHLSTLKGGRLLHAVPGREVLSLIVSDVIGDDPSTVASGPTSPDPTTYADCLQILHRYNLESSTPAAVLRHLQRGTQSLTGETPKPGDEIFESVRNLVVLNNRQVLDAVAERARGAGFRPWILSSSVGGETGRAAEFHASLVRSVLEKGKPVPPPCCLISGGETTVRVLGKGRGGRNQEFGLHCAKLCRGLDEGRVVMASFGTDGEDGPTPAAGAWITPGTAEAASRLGLSIDDHLSRNDSHNFFRKAGGLIETGPTRTNVMDVRLAIVF